MPESPEVEYVAGQIRENCVGRSLKAVTLHRGRYVNHGPPPNYKEFVADLPLKLEEVQKKGKVTILCFSKGWYVTSKLGLTGWWYVSGKAPTWQKASPNVEWSFDGRTLFYSDPLSYGTLTFSKQDPIATWDKLAPDVMAKDTTEKTLLARLQLLRSRRSWDTKVLEELLMDQEALVSGIGNYLKAEVLYDARVSPLRLAKQVTDEEWGRILKSAKSITRRMFKVMDRPETYEGQMRVYRRKEDPHGNSVQTHRTKSGRTTFWVPAVQA